MSVAELPPGFSLHPDHYYDSIPGYFDWPEVYRHAVQVIPDGGTFVELGCWQGQSLAFFLVEAHRTGKKLKVFGVDHFRGSVGEAIAGEAQLKSINAHCSHNLRRAAYPFALIHAESKVGATFFAESSIDYLFIDAGHQQWEVEADIAAWRSKVKPGGWIAGHDYNQAPVEAAVRGAFPGVEIEHIGATTWTWGSCWRVRV